EPGNDRQPLSVESQSCVHALLGPAELGGYFSARATSEILPRAIVQGDRCPPSPVRRFIDGPFAVAAPPASFLSGHPRTSLCRAGALSLRARARWLHRFSRALRLPGGQSRCRASVRGNQALHSSHRASSP